MYFRSKTFVKTIFSRSCARSPSASGAQFGVCVFTFWELQRASYSSCYREPKRTQADAGGQPRIMPADEICIVGRKVAEDVVKRSFEKC